MSEPPAVAVGHPFSIKIRQPITLPVDYIINSLFQSAFVPQVSLAASLRACKNHLRMVQVSRIAASTDACWPVFSIKGSLFNVPRLC